jgi:effector-binding domain-containing protein
VACLQTPAGEAPTAIHRGAYDRLGETYDAITNFVARNGRHLAGVNIEIYGHWRDDVNKLETEVFMLLAR